MKRLSALIRRFHVPITIMAVPHTKGPFLRVKIPVGLVCIGAVFAVIGMAYVGFLTINTGYYYETRRRLYAQFVEVNSSIASLKSTEDEFRRTLKLEGKKDARLPPAEAGTGEIDMQALAAHVRQAIESIAEIKKYLREKHNMFLATPAGLPVDGDISSHYGARDNPWTGQKVFHRGIDIAVPVGTPVMVTADGIVSFSGWTQGSGNIVVVEHGFGFSTAYAHGSKHVVKAGERVRRGDVVMISGTTGVSTGPHLHYEVWRHSRQIDPLAIR